jgi:hypothetical protein
MRSGSKLRTISCPVTRHISRRIDWRVQRRISVNVLECLDGAAVAARDEFVTELLVGGIATARDSRANAAPCGLRARPRWIDAFESESRLPTSLRVTSSHELQ